MQNHKPSVVAGIPAYNEEKNLAKVLVLTKRQVDSVLVCDDGSTDLTKEIALGIGAEVVSHKSNLGYGAALASLFSKANEAGAEVLVTLDADGQHDPTDIPKVVEPILRREADVVIGSRFLKNRTKMPRYRRAGIKSITKLSSAIAYPGVSDAQSGFRAYNAKALNVLKPSEMGMGASVEILAKARESGLKVVEVSITVSYGPSSSTHNAAFHWMDVILATVKHLSIRHPLMFYGFPGLALLAAAGVFWYWTLSIFVAKGTVYTNVALIAVATSIIGILLMAVALLLWIMISVIREASSR